MLQQLHQTLKLLPLHLKSKKLFNKIKNKILHKKRIFAKQT